jgi:hypothetical protein
MRVNAIIPICALNPPAIKMRANLLKPVETGWEIDHPEQYINFTIWHHVFDGNARKWKPF